MTAARSSTNAPLTPSTMPSSRPERSGVEGPPHFAFAVGRSLFVIPQRSGGICFSHLPLLLSVLCRHPERSEGPLYLPLPLLLR